MAKASVIKLPNGIVIEVSPDLTPEQITALVTAVTSGTSSINSSDQIEQTQTGKTFVHERTAEEIWQSSKRDRVALFIRNYFSETLWFNAKDVQDQQLAVTGSLALGETSAIATYLTRLFDVGLLDRKKSDKRNVFYRITPKLQVEYIQISAEKIMELASITV